jgi:hypothetical protein
MTTNHLHTRRLRYVVHQSHKKGLQSPRLRVLYATHGNASRRTSLISPLSQVPTSLSSNMASSQRTAPTQESLNACQRAETPKYRTLHRNSARAIACSHTYPQGPSATLRFRVRNPNTLALSSCSLGYRYILPRARKLHVEVNIRRLAMFNRREFCPPDYARVPRALYFFPGRMYEEVQFHFGSAALPERHSRSGPELRKRVTLLGAMSRLLPKMQESLVELGKGLTRDFVSEGDSKEEGGEKGWAIRD